MTLNGSDRSYCLAYCSVTREELERGSHSIYHLKAATVACHLSPAVFHAKSFPASAEHIEHVSPLLLRHQALLPPPVWPFFFSFLLLCNPRSRTFCLTWFQIAAFLKCCFSSKGANACTHVFACVVIRFFKIANCGLWTCFFVCVRVCGFGFLSLMYWLHFLFPFVLGPFGVLGLFLPKSSQIYFKFC